MRHHRYGVNLDDHWMNCNSFGNSLRFISGAAAADGSVRRRRLA
jgi:hypothetical protein